MKKNSPTEAGPTNSQAPSQASTQGQASEERIDALNQIFALFKRNYHNQFFKAYGNETDVNATKRLWFEALQRFNCNVILRAARTIIENNEFLPTLATMIKACETSSDLGLPEVHAAYLEACRAPSPKANYNWSHLAVYYAGKSADWYFLQSNSEQYAYPVFKQHYQDVCDRVKLGEKLITPTQPALPSKIKTPVDKQKARAAFSEMRKSLDL
ncbi:replication protein P [Teredinibacter franksiae]|uniref:replication protein P n=1 Tax=Teredinibacter franksiae TaxID=2761453 RepID=UPI001629CF8B|nr:replication protein P [Teredinibacter franksiae]